MQANIRDSIVVLLFRKKRYETSMRQLCPMSKLPAMKAANATDELKWAVKALPSDWVPNTKPSNVVACLWLKKQAEHKKSLKSMKDRMVKVNIELEEDIRFRSGLLKEKLKESKRVFDGAMKSIELPEDITAIIISKELFHRTMELIESSINESLEEARKLHGFLLQLEKCRSQKFKVILREAYGEMVAISHKLPLELQKFFEMEILSINQITLSNYRAYEELKVQIMLKLENDKRLWIETLFDTRDDYVDRKKAAFNDMFRGRHSGSFDVFGRISVAKDEVSITGKNGVTVTMATIQNLSQVLAKFLSGYDFDVKIMKYLTDSAIRKIYSSNYDDVQNISIDLNNIHSDYQANDLKDEIWKTFFDSSNALNQYTVTMMTQWESFRQKIQLELIENVRLFTSAVHLWDDHYVRIFELKELTIVDLKKAIKKNCNSENVQLCKTNVLIDRLREASSKEELQGLMGQIKNSLEKVTKNAESNFNKEITFFSKYKQLAEDEASIFLSEVDMFLEHYSKNEEVDPTLQRGRASWMKICMKEEVPDLMMTFEKMLKSIKNWIFGLRETIQKSRETYHSDFMKSADAWVQEQCFDLHRKMEIKNVFFNPMLQRVYEYIYKTRLAELNQHEERLERHKLAINVEVAQLKEVGAAKLSSFEEAAHEFARKLPDYVTKSEKMKSSSGVEFLINQLKHAIVRHSDKTEETEKSFSTIIEDTLNNIRIVDMDYMKCLKLFNEGGNYSPGEVKKFKNLFNKISKKLNRDVRPIEKQFHQKLSKGVTDLDGMDTRVLNDLIQYKEELQFHEDSIHEIKSVRGKIKRITYNLRYRYKMIEQLFDRLAQAAKDNAGSLEYLEEFVQNCKYLEGAFQEGRRLLYQDVPFRLNPQLFRDEVFVNASTVKSTLGDILGADESHFNMVLFERVEGGNDYIASVVDVLYTSLTEVQTKAKGFYGKYSTFLIKATVPDIKTFMLELLAKYLYYELQCEEVWLEMAVEYSIKIEDVLEFIRNYYLESIRAYVDLQIEEVKKKCVQYTTKVNDQYANIDDRFKKLHNKLKPLHGHPKNRSLVEDLEAQKDELNAYVFEAQDEILSTFEEIKNGVQTNLETFEINLWEAEVKLKDNLDGYFSLIVEDGSLLHLIKERIDYFGLIISSDYFSCENSEKYNNIIIELNMKLNELKKGLTLTTKDLLRFSNSISSIKKVFDYKSYLSLDDTAVTNSFSYINVMDLIELYRRQQEFCLAKINFSKDLIVVARNWNDQWDNDLKKIRDLYTVKYTQPKN